MVSPQVRLFLFFSIAFIGLEAIVPSTERAATTSARPGSTRAFQDRVSDYARLRERLILRLRADERSGEGSAAGVFQRALADAIRDARRNAVVGDMFGPDMTDWILRTVRADMSMRQPAERAAILSEAPALRSVAINDVYPESAPLATMPPLLLAQLVPLPAELQYRFLENAIVLIDIDAYLIVDVISNVFKRGT